MFLTKWEGMESGEFIEGLALNKEMENPTIVTGGKIE